MGGKGNFKLNSFSSMKPFMMKRVPVTLLTCLNVPNSGAVELRNTIAQRFQLDLPATLTFDYPTTAAMAKYLGSCMLHGQFNMQLTGGQNIDAGGSSTHGQSLCTEIVAVSSRHPGQSVGLNGFMCTIVSSADLQRVAPINRWDTEAAYSPKLIASKESITTRFAAFCEDIEMFDTAAFKLSYTEAVCIDTQVRYGIWHAQQICNAGI